MLLTPEQLQQIRQIIADHHSAFIVNTVSPDAVSKDILQRLKDKGLIAPQIASIEDSYIYGQVVAAMEAPNAHKMSYDQFKKYVKTNPVPLSQIEKQAVQIAQQQAGEYITNLGSKAATQTAQTLINEENQYRANLKEDIKTAVADNIARRESIKKLKSQLGHLSGDWSRDWDRVAVTEKGNAMDQGAVDALTEEYGEDVLVFRRPLPGHCKHCDRLYLGSDGHPKVFKLSTLIDNGTNVGKKAADWLPIATRTHPNCVCTAPTRMPEGWGFNEEGDLSPTGEGGKLQKAEFTLQGHTSYQGIPVAIENKAGTYRTWGDPDGRQGKRLMHFDYGYVKRTNGADEDAIDCYLGPHKDASTVYICEQQNPMTGIYDEAKVMLGWYSQKEAEEAYRAHFDRPDFLITTTPMKVDQFKRWISPTLRSEGHMMKGVGPTLVIPLKKAERGLQSVSGTLDSTLAAQESPAGNRNPGPGTVSNYLFNSPDRTPPEGTDDKLSRELLTDIVSTHRKQVSSVEEYEITESLEKEPHKFILPDNYWGDGITNQVPTSAAEVDKNRTRLEDAHIHNIKEGQVVEHRPKKKAPIINKDGETVH